MERSTMTRHIARLVVLATVLAAPMAAQGQTAPAAPENVNPAVLEINGETVYAAEISMTMQNIAAQIGGRDKVEDEQALAQMATQRVVEQTLLAQEARRTNVQPNELRMAEMMQALEQQAGGRQALEANLQAFGMTYAQMEEYIRELELSRALIEKQISPTISVTDDDARAFYDENPQLFEVEEQVRARHIIFNCTLTDSPEKVASARAKAEDARRRALAGEDFAELARELSEEPETAPRGGDLGWFTRGQTAPQFANAAFALQPGGIAPVVRTEYGFHVITVDDRRPAGTVSYDEVKDRVRGLLIQQQTGQKVGQLIESLGENAEVLNLIDGTSLPVIPQ